VALDAAKGLKREELLRVVRPLGKAYRKDKEREVREALYARAGDFQARLADGLLVQASGPGLAVLEAKTGKRLWGAEAPRGLVWAHPLAAGGILYAVQGAPAISASYTHWPMTLAQRILATDLKTGQPRWAWEWKAEMPALFARQGAGGRRGSEEPHARAHRPAGRRSLQHGPRRRPAGARAAG